MMKVPSLYPEQVQVLRTLEEGKDVCLLAARTIKYIILLL
jgi:hypothetical protein